MFDPVSRRRVRLTDFTYSVAWMMDGRDLASLARRIRRDLHISVSIDALHCFVDQLRSLGLLETESEVHDTVAETGGPTVAISRRQLHALLAGAR